MKKKIVWIAGAVLLLSFVWPQLPWPEVAPQPEPPPVDVVPETDPALLEILKKADAHDLRRIAGVYTALADVLRRDAAKKRLATTEQWAEVHERTLQLAIDTPGKYPGLDEAIEAVFLKSVGTDDVLPTNDTTRGLLIRAAGVVADTATAAQ